MPLPVWTVRIVFPEPPDDSVTDAGLTDTIGPCLTSGLTVAERLIVPEKPLKLARDIVYVAEVPARIGRLGGFAVIVKSGVGLPLKLAVWTFSGSAVATPPFTPVTVTQRLSLLVPEHPGKKPIFAGEEFRTL